MTRMRVAIIFGGRSGEHEVSVVSASSIFKHIDRGQYDPIPIRIEKDGRWVVPREPPAATSAGEVLAKGSGDGGTVVEPFAAIAADRVDAVFPVLHGPYGEDGTIQGVFELANVPYVGAGVLASAVGMDKAVMKRLFDARGLRIVPYLVALRHEWARDPRAITGQVSSSLRYPVFVKPANLGSSVGISKAASEAHLAAAMELALAYDRKVVVEQGVPDAREIECAVLGNDDPQTSVPGEIIPTREFYDYESKYLDDGVRLLVPAPLTPEQAGEVARQAVEAFKAVDCSGMCRVDFLMARQTGETFLNEVNTIPGFTTVSMYPRLWEATGVPYPSLIDRLIRLAVERHAEKQSLRTSIV
jgi:D-alanine-D-alanine ligase